MPAGNQRFLHEREKGLLGQLEIGPVVALLNEEIQARADAQGDETIERAEHERGDDDENHEDVEYHAQARRVGAPRGDVRFDHVLISDFHEHDIEGLDDGLAAILALVSENDALARVGIDDVDLLLEFLGNVVALVFFPVKLGSPIEMAHEGCVGVGDAGRELKR